MSATTSLDPQPAATAVTTALQHAAGRAADYARAAHAANTHRAYRVDWRDFAGWCDTTGLIPMPAEPATVGTYLADRAATRATATPPGGWRRSAPRTGSPAITLIPAIRRSAP